MLCSCNFSSVVSKYAVCKFDIPVCDIDIPVRDTPAAQSRHKSLIMLSNVSIQDLLFNDSSACIAVLLRFMKQLHQVKDFMDKHLYSNTGQGIAAQLFDILQ